MPRFVILEHDHPEPHLDFMLEGHGALLTWRLPLSVLSTSGETITVAAEQLPDHRLHYLTYEGPVSGNRGTVRRREFGEFEWRQQDEGHWRVELHGQWLATEVEIVATSGEMWCRWRPLK